MISIPLSIFLFIYFLFLVVFLTFSLINVWHIAHTGAFTTASFVITIIVSALTVATFLITWKALQGTDWKQTITVGGQSAVTSRIIE